MNVKMKCRFCGKDIDVTKSTIPAQWFGRYKGDQLVEVTCSDCIKEHKEEWSNGK